jgi:hypothetical protein
VEICVVKWRAVAPVATALEKLSVHVDNFLRTRLLVKVVHVLYNWAAINYRGGRMSNLENALQQIREERKQAQLRMEQLDQVIRGLVGLNGSVSAGKGAGRSRIMSASARRRISLAQKARWARVGAGNIVSIASKRGKRTISAAGRKRIAAAQRARWAKVRAGQKKAA